MLLAFFLVMFSLRFDPNAIEFWAAQFGTSAATKQLEEKIAPRAKKKGYLDKADFVALCEWNSKRPRALYRANADDFIRAVTHTSFATKNERLRIEILTLLKGVSMPMGSVLLHFCSADPYPILDRMSLWSVQATSPSVYHFEFWWEYVQYTRKLAKEAHVTMRVLDRALWQYAASNQA